MKSKAAKKRANTHKQEPNEGKTLVRMSNMTSAALKKAMNVRHDVGCGAKRTNGKCILKNTYMHMYANTHIEKYANTYEIEAAKRKM